MRIIAGLLGGRNFDAPSGHRTHPMSAKTRGGLFNALGDISGLSVLDTFAGSGAMGFEALSRGAANVLAIESDRRADQTIRSNAQILGLTASNFKVVNANINGWLANNPNQKFNIIIADPPFDDTQTKVITNLIDHLDKDGLLVLNWPGKTDLPDLGLELVSQKDYGDSQIAFYRK